MTFSVLRQKCERRTEHGAECLCGGWIRYEEEQEECSEEVQEMTSEQFDRLNNKKKLEWLEALQEEVGRFGVLAEPVKGHLKKPEPTP